MADMRTYDQWRAVGRVVERGQFASGHNADGIATFRKDQTVAEYDEDDDDMYDDPLECWARELADD